MEELQVIETTSGRQFKPWASREDVQAIKQKTVQAVVQAVQDPESVTGVASEIASGKQAIAAAINAKGGSASATESFSELAEKVSEIDFNGADGFTFSIPFKPKNVLDLMDNSGLVTEIDCNMSKWTVNNYNGRNFISNFINTTKVTVRGVTNGDIARICKCPNLKEAYFPDATVFAFNSDSSNSVIYHQCCIIAPNVTNVTGVYIAYQGITKALSSIVFGTLLTFPSLSVNHNIQYNLRNFTIGKGTDINLPLGFWDARNVIAEGQSGIDELNNNIQNHFIANLADNTGLTAKTVTFGQNLRNVLTAETEQMFADKNWNIAPAKTV